MITIMIMIDNRNLRKIRPWRISVGENLGRETGRGAEHIRNTIDRCVLGTSFYYHFFHYYYDYYYHCYLCY